MVSTDNPPLDNDETEVRPRTPSTGNSELDDILQGSEATDSGNKGWKTPLTPEEFERQIRNIPGAVMDTHTGPGIYATLPDGTTVSTYPTRDSTGHPGYLVTTPEGDIIKGYLVGPKEQ